MDIEDAYKIGHENARAKVLLANHCLNADLDVRVSPLGKSVRLPIGFATIRCQHAPFFGESMMDGVELGVRFYEANCKGCAHRRPSGQLPTIASEAEQRTREREEAEAEARDAARQQRASWKLRQDARDRAMEGQPYPVRDLKPQIDVLDPDPDISELGEDERASSARRKIVETARAHPQLFTDVLIKTVVALAQSHEPTAYESLGALAERGFFPIESAAHLAAVELAQSASPEAGAVVAAFAASLSPDDVAAACPGALWLTIEPDHLFREHWVPQPAALQSLARVAWSTVVAAVISALEDDSDEVREVGAHAARHLISDDFSRLSELALPLIRAIRRRDEGYAGRPQPTSAAVRALTVAWSLDPVAASALIESNVAVLDEDGREDLADVPRRLFRRFERGAVTTTALEAAVAFLIRRLDGSWGDKVSMEAAEQLARIAREYPDLLGASVGDLFGRLLAACQAPQPVSFLLTPRGPLDDMEQMLTRQRRQRLRSELSEALGRLARSGLVDAINRAFTLLAATTGDSEDDVAVRSALLEVLEHAVSPDNVARILPHLYTCLLSGQPAVRARAIDLWKQCACTVTALPSDLEALLPQILRDPYVVVHGGMAEALPRLKLSHQARKDALTTLLAIVRAHRAEGGDTLRDTLCSALWSAECCESDVQAAVAKIVIEASSGLSPFERERILLNADLSNYRATPEWANAALDVLASNGRSAVVNREDPLLEAALASPAGFALIDMARFEAIALHHVSSSLSHAAELIELLQAADRWTEAQQLAVTITSAIPQTTEYASRRAWFEDVTAAVAAEAAASIGARPSSVAGPPKTDGARLFAIHAAARLAARDAITRIAPEDPLRAAEIVDGATQTIKGAAGGDRRVTLHVAVLEISALLLRYDAAMRVASPDADRHGSAARRRAELLERHATTVLGEGDAIAQFAALATAASAGSLDELLTRAATVPVALPLADGAFGVPRRTAVDDATRLTSKADDDISETPVLVCIPRLNDELVLDTKILRPGMAHDLTLELRLETWPEWANQCHIDILSTLPSDALEAPSFQLSRADGNADEYGLRFSKTGTLLLRVDRPLRSAPIDLTIYARFVSDSGRTEAALIAGYERLHIIPFDPSQHGLTERPQIDERLMLMYDELTADPTLDQQDVRAFCRFFTACVNAARSLMFDKQFRAGTRVTEAQFHDALESLLRDDPELGGRLTRRDPLAGGFDDLLHDGIVAELKVVKRTQHAEEHESRYVGQPTQYAVDLGSRLSILIVLDHSPKSAPPRPLENDFRWVYPRQHGLTETRYPSRVAELTISTNWPVPSAWSRRKTATLVPPSQESPNVGHAETLSSSDPPTP